MHIDDCLVEWRFVDHFSVEGPAGIDAEDSAALFRNPDFRKAMTCIKSSAEPVLMDFPPTRTKWATGQGAGATASLHQPS